MALLLGSGCLTDFSGRPGSDGDARAPDGGAADAGDASGLDGGPADAGPDAGPNCGNGVLDPGEECDDGNASNNDDCTNLCLEATCGDGHLWSGNEACDDGNSDQTDACLNDCTPATCGDGHTWSAMEGCDDGNDDQTDACLNDCTPATCGDGWVWSGVEGCDDQGLAAGDGCDPDCAVETGWSCSGQPSSCAPVCGDGLLRGDEDCDDGDTQSGDGCSSSCTVENGWSCAGGEPSACSPICGDGLVRGSEDCDDGGLVAGDGCSPSCTDEILPRLYWHSGSGWSQQLITYAGDPHAPHASEYPIRAAANVGENDQAYVLTATSYHVLRLSTRQWVASGSLSSKFSGFTATSLKSGFGNSQSSTYSRITLIVGSQAYLYEVTHATGNVSADSSNPHPINWNGQLGVTPPSPSDVKVMWLDLDNARGWASYITYHTICGASCLCGSGCYDRVSRYGGVISTANQLYLQDSGCCFDFYDDPLWSGWGPFPDANHPAITDMVAGFYSSVQDRLYIITDR